MLLINEHIKVYSEDEPFLKWIDENRECYVIKTLNMPSVNYLVVHKANCKMITSSGKNERNKYIKLCCLSLERLQEWAYREFKMPLGYCKNCMKQEDD